MSRNKGSSEWPEVLLAWGLVFGAGSAILALTGMLGLAGILGGITGIIGIILTFVIAYRQGEESGRLSGTVNKIDRTVSDLTEATKQLHALTRQIAESDSAQDYVSLYEVGSNEEESFGGDVANEDGVSGGEVPEFAEEAFEVMRMRGSSLDKDAVIWKRKAPKPPLPGNHGWFVESATGEPAERWFARRGRGLTVRKAMPRDLLDALEREGVEPQRIKLDYQLKEHGLAAWYARTYSGDLWKVWRSNRNKHLGVQVEWLGVED